jgi:hypothetical protein
MPDNRYLIRIRQGWFVSVEVPPSLRKVLGRRLKRTLRTRDVDVARARRFRVVAKLKETIEAARRGPQGPQGDPMVAEAMAWRESLVVTEDLRETPGAGYDTQAELIASLVGDRAEALHDAGDERWEEFLSIARGKVTPLSLYVEDWLAEGALSGVPLSQKTVRERRSALRALGSWLVADGTPATVEAVTRRVAGHYVQALLQGDREPSTVGRLLVGIRGYWSWLQRRGYLPDELRNPWTEQAPRRRPPDPGGLNEERAFTDAEIAPVAGQPAEPGAEGFHAHCGTDGYALRGNRTAADCRLPGRRVRRSRGEDSRSDKARSGSLGVGRNG